MIFEVVVLFIAAVLLMLSLVMAFDDKWIFPKQDLPPVNKDYSKFTPTTTAERRKQFNEYRKKHLQLIPQTANIKEGKVLPFRSPNATKISNPPDSPGSGA